MWGDLKAEHDVLVSALGLTSAPVGVKFLRPREAPPEGCEALPDRRYCQMLMEARRGRKVLLTPENISCPASAAAFGFKPLPPKLASGEMLASFGIFGNPAAGKATLDSMTRLSMGEYGAIALGPLGDTDCHPETDCYPDVVVVEGTVEQVMWVALASRYRIGGRASFSTAILQATCVDATLIPFITGQMNATLGCYGCRDATDIGNDETVIGFPGVMLREVVAGLRELAAKALPAVREKRAYRRLAGANDCSDAANRD